jgi:hypothetical protein
MKLELFRQIFENAQMSCFIKIRSVGAELFHADGETFTVGIIIIIIIMMHVSYFTAV